MGVFILPQLNNYNICIENAHRTPYAHSKCVEPITLSFQYRSSLI